MSTQVINHSVKAYVHIAYRALQAAYFEQITREDAEVAILSCTEGLAKLGYTLQITKDKAVLAHRW